MVGQCFHWESMLPMEKSSALCSNPIAEYSSFGGLTEHGFGVLRELAGSNRKGICPRFSTSVTSMFAATVGKRGCPNSSVLQQISWTSWEFSVKKTLLCLGLYPHPITFSLLAHLFVSDSKTSFFPEAGISKFN